MKTWRKVDDSNVGATLLIWRNRALNRFYIKILTWLLSGFVAGILTSIFMAAIGQAAIAQQYARIVFFVVFIGGIIGAFLRYVVFGIEYRIAEKAVIAPKPVFGLDVISRLLGIKMPSFGEKLRYVRWDEVQDIKVENRNLEIVKKDGNSISLGISPVVSLTIYSDDGRPVTKKRTGKYFAPETELDKEATRLIRQKAKESKKKI